MTSSLWNWLLFTLIQRDKIKWVCVTLNEGYLRSAKRGTNNLHIFNQNITYPPSMKRRIFLVCLFYCFFRLPIYESIAAIFWKSASYVLGSITAKTILRKLTEVSSTDDMPRWFSVFDCLSALSILTKRWTISQCKLISTQEIDPRHQGLLFLIVL